MLSNSDYVLIHSYDDFSLSHHILFTYLHACNVVYHKTCETYGFDIDNNIPFTLPLFFLIIIISLSCSLFPSFHISLSFFHFYFHFILNSLITKNFTLCFPLTNLFWTGQRPNPYKPKSSFKYNLTPSIALEEYFVLNAWFKINTIKKKTKPIIIWFCLDCSLESLLC
jgi:hypothetical protein